MSVLLRPIVLMAICWMVFHSCYFTMVAVDAGGKPVAVPSLDLITDEQKERFEQAKLRRHARKKTLVQRRQR